MSAHFTIFDVETNGLVPNRYSVLSFSALHVRTWRENGRRFFHVQDEFDRYYYPQEPYNRKAIEVNGLTREVIASRRERTGGLYPVHFFKDKDVSDFCRKTELAVCHNTPFDSKFLKHYHGYEFPRLFCTMREFTEYCAIPHQFYRIKWPKLEEAVMIICGRNDFAFHDSLADCYAVLEILKIMGNAGDTYKGQRWSDYFDRLFI